jgi:hypothetical protein
MQWQLGVDELVASADSKVLGGCVLSYTFRLWIVIMLPPFVVLCYPQVWNLRWNTFVDHSRLSRLVAVLVDTKGMGLPQLFKDYRRCAGSYAGLLELTYTHNVTPCYLLPKGPQR